MTLNRCLAGVIVAAWLAAACEGVKRDWAQGIGSESESTGSPSSTDAQPGTSVNPNESVGANPSASMTSVPGSSSAMEAVSTQPDAGDAEVQNLPDSSSCNACTSGETSCTAGELTVCELQNGCWTWGSPRMCPDGTCVNTVNCSTCIDLCSQDTEVCSEGSLQTCELGPDGCNGWSTPSLCPSEQCADDTMCFVCDDTCEPGEASCVGGELSRCEENSEGCYDWGTPTVCDPATCATETSCTACDNQCDVGDTSCDGGNLQTCVADAEGCLDWSTPTPCDTDACSSSTACLTCSNQCSTAGETSCQSGQFRTCVADSNGCLDWGSASTCPTTAACSSATQCLSCDDGCSTEGSTSCSGGQLKTCVEDGNHCLDWSSASACGTGTCSSSTACLTCDNKCSTGATSCTNGQVKSCVADSNGCLDWGASTTCDTGSCASSSACFVCNNTCTSGTYNCNGSDLRECTADAQGCYAYRSKSNCGGSTPVCSAGNGRCECQAGAAPTCSNSTTARQCSSGAWTDDACSGSEPVCVDGRGCQACTEHSQCPNSACHLSGAKQGTCFATNTVVNVANSSALANALNDTGGESVIKLSAATFTLTTEFVLTGETAIIGQSGTVIVDNMPWPGDSRGALIHAVGIVYIAKLELRNTSLDHTGFAANTGGVVWVDDTKITGQYRGVISNGEFHLRRSSVSQYSAAGGSVYYSGSLFVENSMIGPAASGYGSSGVGTYNGGVLDVRYSTVVGNDYGVGCTVGNSSGRIGNSVIASNINGFSINDGSNDCSQAYDLENNAVDQAGYGATIATYNAGWFVSASTGNLHLSAAGKVAIPKIAEPAAGDPSIDFDGNARPASGGYLGADQP